MSLDFSIKYPAIQSDSFNITHNVGVMAEFAGIYKCLWRPEENGYKTAADVIPILEAGLRDLRARPEFFKKYNSPNGYGTYEGLVRFVEEVLECCHQHPEGLIEACR